MGSLLKILAAILGFPALIASWFQRRADQQQGALGAASRVQAASLEAETRIAQAEASAPKTDAAVEERLRDGTF